MKQRNSLTPRGLALALLAAGALAATSPAGAAPPPANRTYFVVALGVGSEDGGAYEAAATCVSFSVDELCVSTGDCGEWWRIPEEPKARKQWAFGFELDVIDDATGQPLRIGGAGRVDTRGPRSSLGLAGHGMDSLTEAALNFALAGRSVSPARCERLVNDFEAEQAAGRWR